MNLAFGGLSAALAILAGCGVAREVGKKATEGAIEELATEQQPGGAPEPGTAAPAEGGEARTAAPPVAVDIGSGVAAGAVRKLAEPRQLEDVESLAEAAGAAFARSFTRELALQLGETGEGTPAAALSAAGAALSAGAIRGAADEMGAAFPECRGADAGACIRRQVEELGRAGTTGAREGAGIWSYLLAGVIGAALALLVIAALGGVGLRRSERRA